MKISGNQRWALSFADLALLLLGFFVMLQAKPNASHLSSGLRTAFGASPSTSLERPARDWFEQGEAVLTPKARAMLRNFAGAAGDKAVTVSSSGTEPDAARFDGWELAAARTAAVARALSATGIAQGRIAVAIDPATRGGQTIRVTLD